MIKIPSSLSLIVVLAFKVSGAFASSFTNKEFDFVTSQQAASESHFMRAVLVKRGVIGRSIVSYSLIEGNEEPSSDYSAIWQTASGNVNLQVFSPGGGSNPSQKPAFLEKMAFSLDSALRTLWPESVEFSLKVNIIIVPSGTKISDETIYPIKDKKLELKFFFQENEIDSYLAVSNFVQTLSHEIYHLYAELFAPKPVKIGSIGSLHQQEYNVMNELSANLFGACQAFTIMDSATILGDVVVNWDGRRGTLGDASLLQFLNTKKAVPRAQHPQIGVVIFHTLWVSSIGQQWVGSSDNIGAQYLLQICARPEFGKPMSQISVVQSLANDGRDAAELPDRPMVSQ